MIYDIEAALQTPPEKPSIPLEEAVAGEPEYYQWQDWLRYQEALTHQTKMYEGYADYCERVKDYIRKNCIANPTDETIIMTPDDWEAISNAALCPQVTIDDIKIAMSQNFGARWAGKEIFDALATVEGGMGEYISTRVWDTELMVKLGETEEAFSERSIKSRARMIAALKIPQFFGILETDRSLKEMRSKS